ncbi:MAG: hypothetical protein ACI4UF_01875 [Thermoguttaceae bacterium]
MKFHQLAYQKDYVLPVATTTTIGGIAVDGDLFTIDTNNLNRLTIDPVVFMTQTLESVQIGDSTHVDLPNDIAIGNGAKAYGSSSVFYDYPALAVGRNAFAEGASAIQLGPGSNNTSSLSVGFKTSSTTANYTLLNLDGTIPYQRLPIADTNVGAVKADGTTISNSSGTLSAASATNSSAGIVVPDNVSLEIDGTSNKLQSKVPYVTAQSISGFNGYRYWSDGTKECWGLDETNSTTVTVDLSAHHFTDPPHVLLTPRHTGNSANAPAVTAVTANDFTMNTYQAAIKILWKAIGK